MSNSDGNENELENSPTPTSIPPNGSPNILSISKTPEFENQVSVSLSTEEVNKRSCFGDENDDDLHNSTIPTPINPTGSPISVSISKTPKLENQVSVSHSSKRSRIGDENDDEAKISTLPTSINPIGYPNSVSVWKTPKLENQVSVSRSTKELKKRPRNVETIKNQQTPTLIPLIESSNSPSVSNTPKLVNQSSVSTSTKELNKKRHEIDKNEEITKNSPTESTKKRRLGDEIDENDEGFITPTDINHMIPKLTECPPAPRKPGSRKSKSPPATSTAARRSIFPVDVSDEEAESLFPPRVED